MRDVCGSREVQSGFHLQGLVQKPPHHHTDMLFPPLPPPPRSASSPGHTSSAFSLCVYACGYCIWLWNWRHGPLPRSLTWAQEFRADLVNVLAKAWMLGMLSFAWGVGLSR